MINNRGLGHDVAISLATMPPENFRDFELSRYERIQTAFSSYERNGFPVEIIKQASTRWQIKKHGDGKHWWEENEEAKLDKFIYAALKEGFKVSDEKPTLPCEPDIINTLRSIRATA